MITTKTITRIGATVTAFLLMSVPVLLYAQASGTSLVQPSCADKGLCQLADLISYINQIISFLIFQISIPIVVLAILTIGVQMIVESKKPEKFAQLKSYLFDVVIGFALILCAYVIVKFIYGQFVAPAFNLYIK
jgi:hypothetical protein